VKCPKCSYLGFETGDRCRNCGYDFSLLLDSEPTPVDIDLELRHDGPDTDAVSDWTMRTDVEAAPRVRSVPAAVRPSAASPVSAGVRSASKASRDPKLPLFTSPAHDRGDEPLIKLPVTPRPPLAVRRTPDNPRMRVVSSAIRSVDPAPALEFDDAVRAADEAKDLSPVAPAPLSRRPEERAIVRADVSGPVARAVAAAIDHVLLGAIDLAVVYFTSRIAGLSMDEWTIVPLVPLLFFLFILKIAYFYAFTAVGGQTIGKMALRIRVVNEDHGAVDATLALRRTLLGAASTAAFGLGLLPAFFDPERRAFHDRVARTRVIALRTA
jgi:uncharacterized RDD family membrane protein YckC